MPESVAYTLNGVEVVAIGLPDITEDEMSAYIAHVREKRPNEELVTLTVENVGNGQVSLGYTLKLPKFERIRRITGKPTVSL